jgi:hypothetical protein
MMKKKGRILWILILVMYFLYAGVFIYRTSFVINGQRYFTLFDDEMISMRYAKNLAQGQGLVWNPGGERIEGFSNPAWVLFMAFFHLFPISPLKISLVIQIWGAIFMVLNLFLVKRISDCISGNSNLVSLGAVAMTAFYFPLNNWALQGTEVSLLTLLMSLVVWQTLRLIKEDSFSFWPYFLMAVGSLIRMDMMIPYLAILTFLIMSSPRQRLKNLGWGLFILLAFSGLQTLLRFSYFHELLPNTYYLKMTGYPLLLRLAHGIYVFLKFVYLSNWVLILLPLSIFLFRRDREIGFLFWIILGQISYSIWVGGDAWESWGGSNRYTSIVMPIFIVLFAYALLKLGELFHQVNVDEPSRKRRVVSVGLSAFAIFSLINFNILKDSTPLKNWLLVDPPPFVSKNELRVREALLLSDLTDERAVIAVTWAGALPYFADRKAIDILGKTDKVIAREDVRILSWPGKSILSGFIPGHLKWDYSHSFASLKPDVIAQTWLNMEGIEYYLKKYYVKRMIGESLMYFRKNSSHVLWEKLRE